MNVTFIIPSVGKKADTPYPRSWLMEPLSIAVLSALTPPDIDRQFYDDRLESIPMDEPTDLVAISVETYTARRAYQIADAFRRRGVAVVVGGFHPSLAGEDALQHADAIVVGEAEETWPRVLADARENRLQRVYKASHRAAPGLVPDRSIYGTRPYLDLALVETARGCRHACEFCSIAAFFQSGYSARPVEDVVQEVCSLKRQSVFFVDDNLTVDRDRAGALFRALIPLKIRWAGQVGLSIAGDDELLDLMRRSGCLGVLVGFESLDRSTLAAMGKSWNTAAGPYEDAMASFRRHHLSVYGTFVFGYDGDTPDTFERTLAFSIREGLYFAAFNHLVPFPGTPLYERLQKEGRLIDPSWWTMPDYRFGELAFHPRGMSREELSEHCLRARRRFYAAPSVLRRMTALRCRAIDAPRTVLRFLALNLLSGRDVGGRQGLPLGLQET